MKFKKILSLLLCVVIIFSFVACSNQINSENITTTISSTTKAQGELVASAVKFDTFDIHGEKATSDIMAGARLVLLNYWEPWEPSCIEQMIMLQELYTKYRDSGLVVIGVYSTEESARDVIDENNIEYPIIICDDNLKKLQQDIVPITYLLDGNGSFVSEDVIDDSFDLEAWENLISEYL